MSAFLVLGGLIAQALPARADNVDGAWSPVFDWPLISVHAAITPDLRVLTYGTKGNGQQTGYFIYDVWDPSVGASATGHMTLDNMTLTDLFCSSQVVLPQSGEIFIAGGDNWTGTGTNNQGNNNSNLFDYSDNTLVRSANMFRARWYSSATVMINGEIYIQGGNGGGDRPEARQLDGSFRLLTGVNTGSYAATFPRNFLAPDGRVFGYDTNGKMYFVSTGGTGSMVATGQLASANAGWTSGAAMYRPGKILQIGGNSNGAAIIDINGPQPTVTLTQSMSSRRQWVSATVLADGKVIGTGGSQNDNQMVGVNNSAEIWDPATGQWHVGPSGVRARLYHSAGLLLPDASVLVSGGGAPGPQVNTNAEIYYPPYLFNGSGGLAVRPQILSAPDTAEVGDLLNIEVNISNASAVNLVKTGSVTHSVNMDQRFLTVLFSQSGNMIQASLPVRATDTPPGYYLMFVLDANGVPSQASMLRINIDATPFVAVDYTPAIGGGGGTAFQLACPSDETLVGVHGRFATYVNQIGPQCVKVDQLGRWIGNPVNGPVTGTTTSGTGFSRVCPRDFAVSGFQGRAAQYVDQVDIQCRALTASGGLTGAAQYLGGTGGAGGTAQGPYSCGTGNPVYALYGRSGGWLDTFGVQCRQAVITPISINSSPVIVNPGTQSGIVGIATSLQISASDGDNDDLTYSATGLPTGLQINPDTGFIDGTPTTANAFNASVMVSDGSEIDTANFAWNVVVAAPLTVDPMPNQPSRLANTQVNYSANAQGGVNVVYKWDFGDGTPETAYSASNAVNHTFAQPGIYFVTLTVNDAFGIPDIQTFVQTVHLPLTANKPVISSTLAYETRAGNDRVWAVNQDNDSVTVIDAVSNAKLTEIPVGTAPRAVGIAPDGRVWVSNKGSATISIIEPTSLSVVQTVAMPPASAPYGIVFSPVANEAFVVLEASGQLLKLDASTGGQLLSASTGPNPRHVSLNAAGTSVYVSRFITPRQPGEETATVLTEIGGDKKGGEVLVFASANLLLSDTIVLQHSDKSDAENQGRGVPNYLGAAALSPDGSVAWVPSKMDNVQRGTLRDGLNINFQNTVRAIGSNIDLAGGNEDYARRIDFDDASIASAAAFDPLGIYMFVSLETSREIAVVDSHGAYEIFRVNTGRAPQGVIVSPDGQKLFVNNFMDRTVGVYDLNDLKNAGLWNVPQLAAVSTISSEKLSVEVLTGKQFFYDARDTRLARDRYLSCASCHNDGGQDGRVWDLTGMGEGLRNTINLHGSAADDGRLHWSENFDEVQDFEGQIRSLSEGTGLMNNTDFFAGTRSTPLGDPKAGISADLDALAAYVASLGVYAGSPYRNGDGSLTAAGIAGREVFQVNNCATCHGGPEFTDSDSNILHDIGTLKASSGQRLGGPLPGIDTPTLLGAWGTRPYLHDGSALTLEQAVQAHNGVALGAGDLANLVAYLQQIDSTAVVSGCPTCTDFNSDATESFGTEDVDGDVTVVGGGTALRLAGNTWRQSQGTYLIKPNTVMEFVFESSAQGEIHGIGFDEDTNPSADRIFRLYGTENWGISDFANYSGNGPKSYQIPVGQYYTGSAMHLVFVNDDDSGAGSNGTFSNVRLFEVVLPPTPPVITNPGNQSNTVNDVVSLNILATDVNEDPLGFSATGLPTGLSIALDGAITGTTTTAGTFNVTVTVDDGNGGTDDADFDWIVQDTVATCADCLNFNVVTTGSYSNQDNRGNVTVEDGGLTILLADNTQRRSVRSFNIASDTVLEFDFESTDEPEISGIGFDENNSHADAVRVFALHGTQNWSGNNHDYDNYSAGSPKHYSIPVGLYFTGSNMQLVFVNDYDAGPGLGSHSRFSNVRVVTGGNGNLSPTIVNPGVQATDLNGSVNVTVSATDPNIGDTLSFGGSATLPQGLSVSSNGVITGTATNVGSYDVNLTVSDGNGGIDSASFQWSVCDPVLGCNSDYLDFNVLPTNSYSNQDQHGNVSVQNAGLALAFADNTQRKTIQTFTITADSVLEFDFESSAQGEVQGIGFDENNSHADAIRVFQLYGTQNWSGANHDFDNYAGGGPIHYVIPVGQYYTGSAMHLVFLNDYDAGTGIGSSSRFSNIRIVSGGSGNLPPVIVNPGIQTTSQNSSVDLTIVANDPNTTDTLTFSDSGSLPTGLSISNGGTITGTATSIGTFNVTITVDDGNGGVDSASLQWNVCDPVSGCGFTYLDFNTLPTTSYSNQDNHGNVTVQNGGLALALADNTQRRTLQTFNITANTVLEFDFESTDEPEISGIGFDENNSHSDGVRVFALFGTQVWNGNNHDFNDYVGGGPKHYVIPVGQYYTGSAMYLVTINDNDAGTGLGSNGTFSNVRIYENPN